MRRSSLDRLRRHLLSSLGLALPLLAAGCGDSGTNDEGAGVTTNPDEGAELGDEAEQSEDDQGDAVDEESMDGSESSESSDSESSGEDTSTSSSEDSSSSTTGGEGCEVSFESFGLPNGSWPECALEEWGPFGCPNEFYLACVPLEGADSCDELCPEGVCEACVDHPIVLDGIGSCGPYDLDGECCSLVALEDDCGGGIEGRPFIVDGQLRFASVRAGESTRAAPLPSTLAGHLADHWTRVARAEHASVASFARFAAQLLAVGAPPQLIRDAARAAVDETRHARAALRLAAQHRGHDCSFGPLDVRHSLAPSSSAQPLDRSELLVALTLACVDEGCVGETLSALEMLHAAETCRDASPTLARLLEGIAADELRHATLAWRFVAWALDQHPELRPAVARRFAQALPRREAGPAPEIVSEHDQQLLAHGCLPEAHRARLRRQGLAELIEPCAQALLARADTHGAAAL